LETTEVPDIGKDRHPAFLVDQMLGELARWLRLLGYDTNYSKDLNDDELIEYSKEENRVLVTCDERLYSRAMKKGVRALLLRPDSLVNRLAVLARTYGIELRVKPEDSRCPLCNGEIREVDDLAKLDGRVPSKVLSTNRKFWVCNNCSHVYWVGGHWKNIAKTVDEAKRSLNPQSVSSHTNNS
jgi:uncharacterized protein with PIN domain